MKFYHNIYSASKLIPIIKITELILISEAHIIDINVPHILCYFTFYDTKIDNTTIIIINDVKHSLFNSMSSNLYIGIILSFIKFTVP